MQLNKKSTPYPSFYIAVVLSDHQTRTQIKLFHPTADYLGATWRMLTGAGLVGWLAN